jgi:hypothetical protein
LQPLCVFNTACVYLCVCARCSHPPADSPPSLLSARSLYNVFGLRRKWEQSFSRGCTEPVRCPGTCKLSDVAHSPSPFFFFKITIFDTSLVSLRLPTIFSPFLLSESTFPSRSRVNHKSHFTPSRNAAPAQVTFYLFPLLLLGLPAASFKITFLTPLSPTILTPLPLSAPAYNVFQNYIFDTSLAYNEAGQVSCLTSLSLSLSPSECPNVDTLLCAH